MGRTGDALPLTDGQLRSFAADGYLVLKAHFSPAQVAQFKAHVDRLWQTRRQGAKYVIDVYLNEPAEKRIHFTDAADDARAVPYKLNDLHLEDPVVQQFSTDPRLVDALRQLVGANPLACNTLLLEHGSQQGAHFDTFYMPSPSPNKMIATWIAFDRVTETNGPLFYYRGSHRVPPFRFSTGGLHAVPEEMPAAHAHIDSITGSPEYPMERFMAEPGDVLIWHAQLLHGGSPIARPGETRLSLVTHYWTEQDFPGRRNRVDLGGGRAILRRDHQPVPPRDAEQELQRFVQRLATPAEHRAAAPEGFDPAAYLRANPDVYAHRADPYVHYALFGRAEGRRW